MKAAAVTDLIWIYAIGPRVSAANQRVQTLRAIPRLELYVLAGIAQSLRSWSRRRPGSPKTNVDPTKNGLPAFNKSTGIACSTPDPDCGTVTHVVERFLPPEPCDSSHGYS